MSGPVPAPPRRSRSAERRITLTLRLISGACLGLFAGGLIGWVLGAPWPTILGWPGAALGATLAAFPALWRAGRVRYHRRMSLFWRVYWTTAALLVLAALLLAFSPVTISSRVSRTQAVVLAAGLLVLLAVNLVLLRRSLGPLRRLTALTRRIDLLRPGQRLDPPGEGEVAELVGAFNQMLERLEAERAESARRTLRAQESERRRIAQELHDEVGQTLTVVLLRLKRVSDGAPANVREDLEEAQAATRAGLVDVGRVVRQLRPEALDDLGLASALTALCTGMSRHAGLRVERHIDTGPAMLAPEDELVIYRVAQEALTNVVRHAVATRAELTLARSPNGLMLRVVDDGRGLVGGEREDGGIRGMRERALLVHGRLDVAQRPEGGVEVRLEVPATRLEEAPRA